MLTRRLAVLASALTLSVPAWAQQHRSPPAHPPAPHPPAGRGRNRDPVATGSPADSPLGPVDTSAKWAVALDFTTGATLLEKGADEEMPPSSMTKLMTMYLVYERLKQGRLKLDDQLTVSERAWKMGGSKMFVQVGTQVRVEDLIRGVIVQSGNDAAVVLAEALSGSEEQFVEAMNAKAKLLGLKHSQFRNCTGWPDPEQHMSVRDIATVARHIILDFPEYYHYDAEKSFKYNNIDQENRNPLVQKGTADGLAAMVWRPAPCAAGGGSSWC
jgi:serine-type D-Ala-D-Ala carboxypeptidase (penicillin-binding protein 5/6)